jgi:hypothetical protein
MIMQIETGREENCYWEVNGGALEPMNNAPVLGGDCALGKIVGIKTLLSNREPKVYTVQAVECCDWQIDGGPSVRMMHRPVVGHYVHGRRICGVAVHYILHGFATFAVDTEY